MAQRGPEDSLTHPDDSPTLLEIDPRHLLRETGAADLGEVPSQRLDAWREVGFDWVWLLGVWAPSPRAEAEARQHAGVRAACEVALGRPLEEGDLRASPFAVGALEVDPALGGEAALARLRDRMARRGLRLMIDFVPNHVALDHPWVLDHPQAFVPGDPGEDADGCARVETAAGPRWVAHGRDPYFPPWTDTAQVNMAHPDGRELATRWLERCAELADGVRADMAMLVLPQVFDETWGARAGQAPGADGFAEDFWPQAIARARTRAADFQVLAEVYWDLEGELIARGVRWVYDKRLYDRLRQRDAQGVWAHLTAPREFQDRCARFLENHDEDRAAAAFPSPFDRAAAALTYLTPGLRFFHEGQREGRRRTLPVQLAHRPDEALDPARAEFYSALLRLLREPAARAGDFQLLSPRPAGRADGSELRALAFLREHPDQVLLVAANPTRTPALVRIPLDAALLGTGSVDLIDRLSGEAHRLPAGELSTRGLHLHLSPGEAHALEIRR